MDRLRPVAVDTRKQPNFISWRQACGRIAAVTHNRGASVARDSPTQFKGTSLKIIQTQLRTTDPATLHAALTGSGPVFVENELAVLEFRTAENHPDAVN